MTTSRHEPQDAQRHALPRVVYVSSANTRSYADLLPSNKGRSSIVHSLIEALDLLRDDGIEEDQDDNVLHGRNAIEQDVTNAEMPINLARVVQPIPATRSDLSRFHDRHYIKALFNASADSTQSPETSFESDVASEQASPNKRAHLGTSSSVRTVVKKSILGEPEGTESNDHGLEHDCPVFEHLEEYCCHVAGGSITAARELRQGRADVAIFWDGGRAIIRASADNLHIRSRNVQIVCRCYNYGTLKPRMTGRMQRHHATKSVAAGYCYINDIVLAILELQQNPLFEKKSILSSVQSSHTKPKRLKKILYIDLDLHHGDGVADAFETNPDVVTVSLHLWSKGFYPSTPKGHLEYSGPSPPSPAAGTSLNIAVPYSGLSDSNFNRLVEECIKPIFKAFQPDALVLQCGVDGLAGDPCKEFNISLKGYGRAVQSILSWCRISNSPTDEAHERSHRDEKVVPALLLGGGGYHSTNAARAWAYLTSIALGRPLDLDKDTLPDKCKYWETFYNDDAAGEGLDIPAHISRRDENGEADIRKIIDRFANYASGLSGK